MNLALIKEKRTQQGITLKKMADNLGFKNASTYLKYESGEYSFKAEHLPLLSTTLKIDLENFFV